MSRTELITNTSLREYFQRAVSAALTRQRMRVQVDTVAYVVNLLTLFSRTEHLNEQGGEALTEPLASLYCDAVHSPSQTARKKNLQRLGDIALFVSGVFSGYLERRAVGIDYYVSMGGAAYGYLSGCSRSRGPVFDELATNFVDFVDVLGETCERCELGNNRDLLRVYELWLRTGSRRAARRLRALGIHPNEANVSRARH